MRRSLAHIAVLAAVAAACAPAAVAAPEPAPPGQLVASGIPFATNVTFDARGGMWVTSGAPFTQAGDGVWYVAHAGAKPVHVIRGTLTALGLTWFRGRLYVASTLSRVTGIVSRYSGFDGRRFAHRRVVIPAISIGLHGLGTIAPGPQRPALPRRRRRAGRLAGGHVTSGTVVSFKGDGSDLRIEAKGLRGPFGLAFVPGTASLLVTDNGRDDLGAQRPPDELNLVRDVTRAAPDFGFPDCYDQGGPACADSGGADSAPARPRRGRRRRRHARLGWPGADRLRRRERLDRAGCRRAGARCGASSCAGVPGGGYDATGSVFATGFAEQDPLGTAIGPGGALYVTLFGTGAVVRFFPGYGP